MKSLKSLVSLCDRVCVFIKGMLNYPDPNNNQDNISLSYINSDP